MDTLYIVFNDQTPSSELPAIEVTEKNFELKPGPNLFPLSIQSTRTGDFVASSLYFQVGGLRFTHSFADTSAHFVVKSDPPLAEISLQPNYLILQQPQSIIATLHTHGDSFDRALFLLGELPSGFKFAPNCTITRLKPTGKSILSSAYVLLM